MRRLFNRNVSYSSVCDFTVADSQSLQNICSAVAYSNRRSYGFCRRISKRSLNYDIIRIVIVESHDLIFGIYCTSDSIVSSVQPRHLLRRKHVFDRYSALLPTVHTSCMSCSYAFIASVICISFEINSIIVYDTVDIYGTFAPAPSPDNSYQTSFVMVCLIKIRTYFGIGIFNDSDIRKICSTACSATEEQAYRIIGTCTT